jgi:predicted XRE-type DNA-binding protein
MTEIVGQPKLLPNAPRATPPGTGPQPQPAPPKRRLLLEHPEMRRALAHRDIRAIYSIVQRYGISQRRIAAKTGQSQSEVSDILTGKRVVASYDVLARICAGLGVPRGYMGLAYDQSTLDFLAARQAGDHTSTDGDASRYNGSSGYGVVAA